MNETPPEAPPMEFAPQQAETSPFEVTPEPERPRSKRRWQTKALYWLLGIAVCLYALSQSGLKVNVPQATRSAQDEKMVATAQLYGGGVQSKGILPGWEGWVYPEDIQISFFSPPDVPSALDDAALARLAEDAGRGPTGLSLQNTRITGPGLRRLGGLTRLKAFTVFCYGRVTPPPSSESDIPIPRLTLQIGRGDLAGLTGLPKLAMIYAQAGFSADAFRGLPPSRSVRNLTLAGSEVPDEALADLPAAFPALEMLNLANTGISDAGLTHLAAMKEVSYLAIAGNSGITPKGLTSLKALPKLTYLELSGSRFTPADVAELRAARPGLTVELGGGRTLRPAGATR